MSSPFAIFRRHQKAMTVILTGLAMFAFIILGAVDLGGSGGPMGGGGGSVLIPLLSAAVFAGAFWIWGLQDGKGPQDAVTGALVGILIGLVPVVMASRQSGIATAAGTITEMELFEMRRERSLANEIVMRAFQERENAFPFLLQRYQFGGTSTREIVFKYVLNHVARERGIALSNDYVRDFLDEVSDGQLNREKFNKIRTALQVGETEIFDLLRDELEANLAYQLVSPQSFRTPEQYWRDFEKLNVRHTIEATAIPVQPFAAKLDRPSDEELRQLFEEYKNRFPERGEPGFYQPDRVRLAWLQADFETLEQAVGEIPEEDLKARYEERKESFYRIETLPDPDKTGESPPADTGQNGSDQKESDQIPSDSDESDSDESDSDESDSDESDSDESDSDESGGDALEAAPPAPSAAASTGEKSDDTNESQENASADPQDADSSPAADESAAKEPAAAPDSDTPRTDGDAPQPPADTPETEDAAIEAVKYRPFEEVRDEIRDILLRERTLELQRERMAAAIEAVRSWRTEYDEVRTEMDSARSALLRENPDASEADIDAHLTDLQKKLEAAAAAIGRKAAQYAEKHGLTYVETDPLSQQELIDSDRYDIGSAREPLENTAPTAQMNEPDTVATLAFRGATREFFPDEAEGQFDDSRYVYWLTEKIPAHEPSFDEEGIREQVEEAWRAREAAPQAEKRARELAAAVTEAIGEKSMAEALADQTITGDEDGNQVSVITSIPFTWLRQSFQGMQMNPFMGPQPTVELGVIPGIDGVDDQFMRTIAEMKVGDVQAIPNADRSTYYVVHLKSRSPAGKDSPELESLRQQFIQEDIPFSPVYSRLASAESQNVGQRWFATFMAKYGVDLATVDSYQ